MSITSNILLALVLTLMMITVVIISEKDAHDYAQHLILTILYRFVHVLYYFNVSPIEQEKSSCNIRID